MYNYKLNGRSSLLATKSFRYMYKVGQIGHFYGYYRNPSSYQEIVLGVMSSIFGQLTIMIF